MTFLKFVTSTTRVPMSQRDHSSTWLAKGQRRHFGSLLWKTYTLLEGTMNGSVIALPVGAKARRGWQVQREREYREATPSSERNKQIGTLTKERELGG